MKGSKLIENPFSKILEVQGRMFQVKRKLSENQININKFKDEWVTLLKKYYNVDTILRANNELWMCNEIKIIDYVEIKN